jgi:hypothetical protein
MSDDRLSRTSAGLGGMALALVLVGLVVQQARAGTPCEDCQAWSSAQGLAECARLGLPVSSNNPADQQKVAQCRGIRQGWSLWCYSNNWNGSSSPPCPDNRPPLKVCGSPECATFDVNLVCPNPYRDRDGGKICSGNCGNQACGSYSSPGSCKDKNVYEPKDPPTGLTQCLVTCACQ